MSRLLSAISFIIILTGCTTATFIDSVVDGSYFKEPNIKFGEFPFVITYEVDDSKKTIRDTLKCTYDGKESDAGSTRNKWIQAFDSQNEDVVLKALSKDSYVYFPIGSCKAYMDDLPDYVETDLKTIRLAISIKSADSVNYSSIEEDVAEKKYGIRITEWEFTSPISQESSHHNKSIKRD